jgi:glycosyltransferase involved in cell wall biosynthesis
MRLVAVSHSPWLGGAERCLLELAEEVAGRPGREIRVVLPGEGPLREALEAAGARTAVAPARWWASGPGERPPRLDARGALATARVLARLRPDVVLSNTMVHPAGALAARLLGRPHLWWLHELGERDHGFRFRLGLERTLRAIGRLSAAVLASSPVVRRAAEPYTGPVREVPYAVGVPPAASPATGAAQDPPRLAIVGRVRPSKGQQDAVRALAHLPGAVLDVTGDGTPEDLGALRALASGIGVADRVRLHPARPDVLGAFDAADVVLMCSRAEAFGRVTVEAMKRGRPVIAAASGGSPEIVEDGATGLLYPPGDARALAGRCAALLAADDRRAAIAAAGWRTACARYTPAAQADAILSVADDVA